MKDGETETEKSDCQGQEKTETDSQRYRERLR